MTFMLSEIIGVGVPRAVSFCTQQQQIQRQQLNKSKPEKSVIWKSLAKRAPKHGSCTLKHSCDCLNVWRRNQIEWKWKLKRKRLCLLTFDSENADFTSTANSVASIYLFVAVDFLASLPNTNGTLCLLCILFCSIFTFACLCGRL